MAICGGATEQRVVTGGRAITQEDQRRQYQVSRPGSSSLVADLQSSTFDRGSCSCSSESWERTPQTWQGSCSPSADGSHRRCWPMSWRPGLCLLQWSGPKRLGKRCQTATRLALCRGNARADEWVDQWSLESRRPPVG